MTKMTLFILLLHFIGSINCMLLGQSTFSKTFPALKNEREKPRIIFEQISIEQGLSVTAVFNIMQDSQGYMWFATEVGLNRYDGYQFKIYNNIAYDSTSISDYWIWDMIEDDNGDIWVATSFKGVSKMDRATETFTHFKHDEADPASLSHNVARSLFEDRSGGIWIGTASGLNRLDSTGKGFRRYLNDPENTKSISNDHIYFIFQDYAGDIWISTRHGLNRYEADKDEFTRFLYGAESLDSTLPRIYDIFESEQAPGILWLGSPRGLTRLDTRTKATRRFQPLPGDQLQYIYQIAHNPIQPNILWLTMLNVGVAKFNIESEEFTLYQPDENDPNSLSDTNVWSIFSDQSGVLWVGFRRNAGLNKFDPLTTGMIHYRGGAGNVLAGKGVWGVHEDRKGRLWVGTIGKDGGHLNRIDRFSGEVSYWQHDPNDTNSLSINSRPLAICEDYTGDIWIGMGFGNKAVSRLNPLTGQFTHYLHDPNDSSSISKDAGHVIYEDSKNNLWIGSDHGEINLYVRETDSFQRYWPYSDLPASELPGDFGTIYEDLSGTLWIGTSNGLVRFDRAHETFRHYKTDFHDPNSLSGNFVCSIHERAREPGILWIGLLNGGLNRFDTETENVTRFSLAEISATNTIISILEDDDGLLWLGSDRGIYCFDPETHALKKYGMEAGLQSLEFNGWSWHRSASSGEMFFGGPNGLNVFFPDQLKENPYPPAINISDVKLFNQRLQPGPDSPLKTSLAETQEIHFEHWEKDITFDYLAMHYKNPAENTYRYRLTPYENEWVYAGTRRSAAYTNLDPGEYTFQVAGANSDGVWNEAGKSLRIIISPPWWQTAWAYGFYTLLILGLLYAIRSFEMNRQRKKMALQMSRKRAEDAEELAGERARMLSIVEEKNAELIRTREQLIVQEKLASLGQLTAGIAHEIKNPLNFVNNFAELLVEMVEEVKEDIDKHKGMLDNETLKKSEEILADADDLLGEIADNAQKINEHGKRANNIVNGMLQHSRGKSGEFQATDLNALLEEYINLAYHGMRAKNSDFNVTIERDFDESVGEIPLVPQDISRVFLNLLNNAFEAFDIPLGPSSKREARVTVSSKNVGEHVAVHIRDNGPGIPEDVRKQIFNPFFTTKPTGQGNTGLGLSISHDIVVKVHRGEISVDSKPGEFTEFVVLLPKK